MNVKRNIFLIIFFSILLVGSIFLRIDNMYMSTLNAKTERNVGDIYTMNIELSKAQNNVNTYIPNYYENDWQTAKMYAGFFKMDREVSETEDYYLFYNGKASLYVYKYVNYVRYEIDPVYYFKGEDRSVSTDTDAFDYAIKFIENNNLYLNYEETEINYEDGIYTVIFLNRLGNLFNYAFPSCITLDDCGNIISLDYFYLTYDKLGSVKIKSMRDAYLELPSDIDTLTVNIEKCRLIYIFKDSIIQPAYRFEGMSSDLSIFECFIEASTY